MIQLQIDTVSLMSMNECIHKREIYLYLFCEVV